MSDYVKTRIFPILLLLIASGCTDQRSLLERVTDSGELRAVTRNSPTTYFLGPNGPTGFEYELLQLFSERLGVELRIEVPDNFSDILPLVMSGKADVAAAGLTVTDSRELQVRFSTPYQEINQQLVYFRTQERPKTIDDLVGKQLEVIAGSSHVEHLSALTKEHPGLTWTENTELDSEELLYYVNERLID